MGADAGASADGDAGLASPEFPHLLHMILVGWNSFIQF
jgi:hypothetical protein